MENFTHLDKNGNAIMVDVSEKDVTKRIAIASGKIKVCKEIIDSIKDGTNKKGDVLSVSRIAGIMACKKNSELIPLCHPLYITKVALDFEVKDKESIVEARCEVICDGKTGVEMEALTGVSVALLTIYDMCKAIDKNMVIYDICLLHKEGGKSGVYDRV